VTGGVVQVRGVGVVQLGAPGPKPGPHDTDSLGTHVGVVTGGVRGGGVGPMPQMSPLHCAAGEPGTTGTSGQAQQRSGVVGVVVGV
jgi:hypothetical protein